MRTPSTTTVGGVTFHRGIGGGRFAFVSNPEGHHRKIVETASGAVFTQRCDDAGLPMSGFTVHYVTVGEAVQDVTR